MVGRLLIRLYLSFGAFKRGCGRRGREKIEVDENYLLQIAGEAKVVKDDEGNYFLSVFVSYNIPCSEIVGAVKEM